MKHESEFSNSTEVERKRLDAANVMCRTYARLFSTEDGKAVLEDLRRKFSLSRPRFDIQDLRNALPYGAMIEGQCQVLREVEQAIKAGLS